MPRGEECVRRAPHNGLLARTLYNLASTISCVQVMSALGIHPSGHFGADYQPRRIHDLPDELLCIIFTYVADVEPARGTEFYTDHSGNKSKRDKVLGWLRLSEVCARFRSVLLSMAELWTRIAFEPPVHLAQLAIARSQPMPLPVRIEGSYQHYTMYILRDDDTIPDDSVRDHLWAMAADVELAARMCSFSIENPSIMACKKILGAPLPQLEELHLSINAVCPVYLFQTDNTINVDAPAVRLFKFNCIHEPVYHQFSRAFSFRFPALVSFEVDATRNKILDMEEVAWIAGVLQTSPLLELVHLAVGGPDLIDWDLLFNGRTVTFPHLKSLALRGNPAMNVLGLYRHIGSPRPSRCIVSCCQAWDSIPNEAEHMLNFTSTFSALFPHASHDCLAIELTDEDEDDYRMLKLRMSPLFEDPRQHVNWRRPKALADVVEMTVGLGLPEEMFHTQVLDIITKALQGNRVKQLFIEAPSLKIWPQATVAILSACPAVTELVMDHSVDIEKMRYSDFPIPISDDILPALDSVFFQPQIAHEYWDEEPEDIDPRFVLTGMEGCTAWLAWRAREGRRVRQLFVIGDRDDGRETYTQMSAFVDEYADEREKWS